MFRWNIHLNFENSEINFWKLRTDCTKSFMVLVHLVFIWEKESSSPFSGVLGWFKSVSSKFILLNFLFWRFIITIAFSNNFFTWLVLFSFLLTVIWWCSVFQSSKRYIENACILVWIIWIWLCFWICELNIINHGFWFLVKFNLQSLFASFATYSYINNSKLVCNRIE